MVGSSDGAAAAAVVGSAGDDLEGDCLVTEGSELPDAVVGHEGPYDWAICDYDVVNLTTGEVVNLTT